ncbi:hypothetical protein DPMN_017498 [Dreissena polymorpha]|uniref:Uncharacterized protein n=1 Tax=Dreissena polymorpha TaxID=45954 RepID=A0A9D4NFG5_DREPO|nr:hypothetical protein DPMN_017498 [Dreissena polymorpha]
MAPDTKVPDGRTEGRTDGRTDGQRQNNIPPPLAGDNKWRVVIKLWAIRYIQLTFHKAYRNKEIKRYNPIHRRTPPRSVISSRGYPTMNPIMNIVKINANKSNYTLT